jgi:hypothetical protein
MYTLRFPFSLSRGQEIAVPEQSVEVDGLTFSLKKRERFYVFTINGFSTEEMAKHYINNVWAGLMWVFLHRGLSPDAVLEPQTVVYAEDPHRAAKNLSENFGLQIEGSVDSLIDEGRPAVYPMGKQLRTIALLPATFLVTTSAEHVLRFFGEGIAFPENAKVIDDTKLRVALELYGAYFTEFSENARFLTLVMALETLAIGTLRTQLVLDLLDKWKKEVEELLKNAAPESDDAASLEALSRELLFRKEDSIRRQIRTLVLTTLEAIGDEDAVAMARSAVQVYDLRSTLVHEGKLESQMLSKATSDAKNIVERVLRVRFVQQAAPGGKSSV